MNFFLAALLIDSFAMIGIFFTPANKTPLCGTPPHRIWGIFVSKHLIITAVTGTMIGLLSDVDPRWQAAVLGTIFQFITGQLIHLMFGTKTMLLYKCGLSRIPDGTGRLATPVLCPVGNKDD
jgi:hypothetical protein